jgi:hypothetical protein
MTRGLEGRCSIRAELRALSGPGHQTRGSGRSDSNRGPPAPKAGALPSCATPRREHVILMAGLYPVNPGWKWISPRFSGLLGI